MTPKVPAVAQQGRSQRHAAALTAAAANAAAADAPQAAQDVPEAPQAAPAAPMSRPKPFRIRLPGLLSDRDIGLGDVVSRVATHAGFVACGGCRARAQALNQWFVFTGRRSD